MTHKTNIYIIELSVSAILSTFTIVFRFIPFKCSWTFLIFTFSLSLSLLVYLLVPMSILLSALSLMLWVNYSIVTVNFSNVNLLDHNIKYIVYSIQFTHLIGRLVGHCQRNKCIEKKLSRNIYIKNKFWLIITVNYI